MSRNPYGSELYRVATLLSQRVAESDPFFKLIALMGIDDRVRYAMLYVIMEHNVLEMDLENMNEKELIEKVLLPIIQRVGQAKFRADPLTHLGFKVGKEQIDHDMRDEE